MIFRRKDGALKWPLEDTRCRVGSAVCSAVRKLCGRRTGSVFALRGMVFTLLYMGTQALVVWSIHVFFFFFFFQNKQQTFMLLCDDSIFLARRHDPYRMCSIGRCLVRLNRPDLYIFQGYIWRTQAPTAIQHPKTAVAGISAESR